MEQTGRDRKRIVRQRLAPAAIKDKRANPHPIC
jgi:hypothetical protein